MSSEPQNRPGESKTLSKPVILLLGIIVFLLFVVVFSQQAFDLTFLRPDSSQQTLLFVALSAIVFLLFLALIFVLLRNLLKLYTERQMGVLGSKFRTRMVMGALVLSLAPAILLFFFAYGLMNRSIDKWFSRPVEELRENSNQIAELLANYAAENARSEAAAIAASADTQKSFATGNFSGVMNEFRRHERSLQGGFAFALIRDGREEDAMASFRAPDAWGVLREKLPLMASRSEHAEHFTLNGKEYMLGSARVGDAGRILVAMPLPERFSETLTSIEASRAKYRQLHLERRAIRDTYMSILWLLTLLVLFAATWFALFLSKLVTRPVAALAEATQALSSGRMDYRVDVTAADEIGDLVRSFNKMAEELQSKRSQLETSTRELADANVELEQRRRHMETILESIPTGVLSLDADRRVLRTNHALRRMFSGGPTDRKFEAGSTLREFFTEDIATDLEQMLKRADRMGTMSEQMEILIQRAKLNVAVTVASLQHHGERMGYVVVFEDLSDLLKAQKQAAWREVARRVAHEIKNPLTPIALSAERIRRHLERGFPPDESSMAVIEGCAETIAGSVETVRTLVDEFSTLARFPASQPQPSDIHGIIDSALGMFDGRLEGIAVHKHFSENVPEVMADPEAIKRAIANLVDNAAEAMQESLVKEVHISTAVLENKDAVEVVVADTGHGISRELKEKLFLPYFSTKKRGTGLGLSIVSRIIEDHHGTIRIEENSPLGARFIVELPVANGHAAAEGAQQNA